MNRLLFSTLFLAFAVPSAFSTETLTEKRSKVLRTFDSTQLNSEIVETTVSQKNGIEIQLGFKPPQAYYNFDGSGLSWVEPSEKDKTCLFVIVEDEASKSYLGGNEITAYISNGRGKPGGTTVTLTETWDPSFHYYGSNLALDDNQTTANIRLRIVPPKIRRSHQVWGNFFTTAEEITFEAVELRRYSGKEENSGRNQKQSVSWPAGRRPYLEPTPYPGSSRNK